MQSDIDYRIKNFDLRTFNERTLTWKAREIIAVRKLYAWKVAQMIEL